MKATAQQNNDVRIGVLVVLALARTAAAVPANPNPREFTQPDGTPILLFVRGDEHFSWFEDEKGFTVVRDGGRFAYAKKGADKRLVPSEFSVDIDDPQTAGIPKRLLPGRKSRRSKLVGVVDTASRAHLGPLPVAAFGTVRNLVLLCKFSDHSIGQHTRPAEEYDVLFNALGGHSALAPTGSVRDYYLENSYNQLDLRSTIVGWITLPQTEAYYAGGDSGTNAREMVLDALRLADPMVDFSEFDQDRDGWVDAIDIIHSGYGAEFDRNPNRIWSHKWAIATWTSAEGIRVSPYHTEPALWDTSGSGISRIGVIVHETGHFFGLPDLYDTDGSSRGIGAWAVMANSWGFDGSQLYPPHFSAYSKVTLGWVTPTILRDPGTFSTSAVELEPTIYRLDSGFPDGEYLLIENRQAVGFDSLIPQGGLAIWHIDESKDGNTDEGFPAQSGWPSNGNHYRVALLQADGNYDLERGANVGDAADLYRAGGASALNGTTVPNTDAYQHGNMRRTENSLYDIGPNATVMPFTFGVGDDSTDDDLEENDRPEEAATISLGVRYDLKGNDDDWFRLDIANGGILTVVVDGSHGNLDLVLYATDGRVINESLRPTSQERVVATVDAGMYRVLVTPFEKNTSPYILQVELEGDTTTVDDCFEENDDVRQAAGIQLGYWDDLVGQDEDWYRIDVASRGVLIIEINGPDGDLDLGLVSADGVLLGSSTGPTSNERVEVAVDSGPCFVIVIPYDDQLTSPYEMEIRLTGSGCNGLSMCGNGCAQGTAFSLIGMLGILGFVSTGRPRRR